MAHDREQLLEFGRSYTEAWCTRDPARVAEHYAPDGTVAINGAPAVPIMDAAESFMSAFPDLHLAMDHLVIHDDDRVEYHWTFVGTNTGPGGTGNPVRFCGFEEWTIGADDLVATSVGTFDQAEYDRQLAHGVDDDG